MRSILCGLLACSLCACEGEKGEMGDPGMSPDLDTLVAALAESEALQRELAARLRTEPALRGPAGMQGEQGAMGEPGPMGETGDVGPQGEQGLPGRDATRWKVCGVTPPVPVRDPGGFRAGEACRFNILDECSAPRICTVEELTVGALSHDGDRIPNRGTRQTDYLRRVGEQMIEDGLIDAENPYAFVHSGHWSTSCENYHSEGGATKEAFTDELTPMTATVWPLIQNSVAQAGVALSTPTAVSARSAPCQITAPVLCCDADGHPALQPGPLD